MWGRLQCAGETHFRMHNVTLKLTIGTHPPWARSGLGEAKYLEPGWHPAFRAACSLTQGRYAANTFIAFDGLSSDAAPIKVTPSLSVSVSAFAVVLASQGSSDTSLAIMSRAEGHLRLPATLTQCDKQG